MAPWTSRHGNASPAGDKCDAKGRGKSVRSKPISGILLRPVRAMTIIPLGDALPHRSSHLPADSVGHVDVCLFGVAPRRDCPFHPRCPD